MQDAQSGNVSETLSPGRDRYSGLGKYGGEGGGEEEAIRKAFYCNFKQFILQTSYYSYFGFAALNRLSRYESGPVECQDAKLKTTASESNDAKFLKLLQGGWITKVPESARPPDTVPVPDRRSNIEEPFNIAALREMGGLRFAEAQIRNRVRIAAGSSGLPRFPKGTDFGILAQSEASQSTRQDRSEKVHDLKIKDLSALGLDPQVLAEVARFDPEARVDD